MPTGIREFLNSPAGKVTSVLVILVALGLMIWSILSNFGGSDAAAISADRVYMDTATNKPFAYELKAGDGVPVKAPSGSMTGYPTEKCFWTKDGKPKKD